MPYGFGSSAVFTSSAGGDVAGGRQFTRLRGPVLVGNPIDTPGGTQGVPWQAPHIANISTALADVLINAPGQFVSTAGATGFLYMSQTTGTSVPDNSPAPGITGMAAIKWDSAAKTIEVWSTVTGAWMRMHSSSGVTIVFSSRSEERRVGKECRL